MAATGLVSSVVFHEEGVYFCVSQQLYYMARPSTSTLGASILGGLLNVVVIFAVLAHIDYPTLSVATGTAVVATTGFALGFIAIFVTVHTRLLSPAIGYLAVLAGTTYLALSTPQPEWGELNGHIIVDGPTHVLSYANSWYVWLALVLYVGVIEFGFRRGYGIGDHRLRNLPDLPLSRWTIAWVSAGFAGLIGVTTVLVIFQTGIRLSAADVIFVVFIAAVAAIPLVAILRYGVLLPAVLFGVFVSYMLTSGVFVTTESPVHILLFGPYAIVLVLAWVVESALRSRFRGWNGGRFTAKVVD